MAELITIRDLAIAVPLYRRVGSTRWGRDETLSVVALVNIEDYERVMALEPWRYHPDGYAIRKIRYGSRRVSLLMHRVIMEVEDGSIHIDHWDHDPLNNRRSNLRVGTQQANNHNTPDGPRSDSSSRFKGVGRYRGRWRAQGREDGKTVWLGQYDTEELAHVAYSTWKRGRNDLSHAVCD